MDSTKPTLFLADFCYDRFLTDAVLPLASESNLIFGAAREISDSYASPDHQHFDFVPYWRLEDFTPSAKNPFRQVTAQEAEKLHEARRQYQRSLDRVFMKPLSALRSEQYFLAMVAEFEDYIAPLKETLSVVFSATPHFPQHIVFYHVCKNAGVPVYILRRTQIPDLMYVDRGMEARPGEIVPPVKPVDYSAIDSEITKQSAMVQWSVATNDRAKTRAWRGRSLASRLLMALRLFMRPNYRGNREYFRLNRIQTVRVAWQRNADRAAELATIRRIGSEAIPNGKFVYVALHFQPERSTIPEGGFYYDQLAGIKLLAGNLPTGWTVVVKEHPRQLDDPRPDLRRLHWARTEFYEALAAMPNVQLADIFLDSAKLINACAVTATCTGTTAFEGIKLGKPSLTFGRNWHSECASTPCVLDVNDIAETLVLLAEKTPEDIEQDLKTFLQKTAPSWFLGTNSELVAKRSSCDGNILRGGLTTELRQLLAR